MKVSDILRSLADVVEKTETVEPYNGMEPVEPESEDQTSDDTGIFISPLQQEVELMKKSAGVENVFDDPEEEKSDEIEQLKVMAGLNK